jgi:nucleotide-binding universal stress UspA family protein
MPIRKILAPVDFSDASKASLAYAMELAEKLGASVHVVYAWEMPVYLRPDLVVRSGELSATVEEHAHAEAEKGMQKFLEDTKTTGRPQTTSAVVPGIPDAVILDVAEDEKFDLIVLGTHGRTGLSHILLGSVAERVIRRATCPVLTVRTGTKP